MDIYDNVIAACPLYVQDNRHYMSVDLNVIEVLTEEQGLNFEEWFTELLGLCPAITVTFIYNGKCTVVTY